MSTHSSAGPAPSRTMPAFPLLALSLFAVNVLVLYALIQYGGRRAAV